MRFEWDIEKDRINRAKHRVSLGLGRLVFFDRKDIDIQYHGNEERWLTVGRLPTGQFITVVSAQWEEAGEDVIRLISTRKAAKHERRRYDEDT